MKVYVAAPYSARDFIREELAPLLVADGHEVVSRWLNASRPIKAGTINTAPDATIEEVTEYATTDLAEVDEADVVVMLTGPYLRSLMGLHPDRYGSGGRHVEVGYALARGKPVINVGDPENIFTRSLARCVPTFGVAQSTLRTITALREPPAPHEVRYDIDRDPDSGAVLSWSVRSCSCPAPWRHA